MTHTTLFKNEIYLIVTSIISIGVLSGYEYLSIVLAALLIIPVIKLPDRRTFNNGIGVTALGSKPLLSHIIPRKTKC